MDSTHATFAIDLECKQCGHKGKKTLLLKLESTVHIGCSKCMFAHTRFVVRTFVSWSSSSSDMYIKIRAV